MYHGFIKVAAGNFCISVGEPAKNAGAVVRTMEVTGREQVNLLVLPELCVTGYTCGDLFFHNDLLYGVTAAIRNIRIASKYFEMITIVGAPYKEGQKIYNAAYVIYKGEILGIVKKTYLPNYSEFYEQRHFAPAKEGENNLIFRCREFPDFAIGVELCEDLWSPTPPSERLALSGATVIANLSGGNDIIGKDEYRRTLVKAQSGRLVSGYVYANAGDGESTGDMVFGGHSIIAENGTILSELPPFSDRNIIFSEFDICKLTNERMKNTSFHQSIDTSNQIVFSMPLRKTKLTRYVSKTPFVPGDDTERAKRCSQISAIQSRGLLQRMRQTGASRLVVGVSGGLDSSLALLVCAKACDALEVPRERILGVTMPCFGTTARTRANAEKLIKALGAEFREVDITKAVKQHFADIHHSENNRDVTYENAQARERTQVLMDIANEQGGIVVGTGDLSEIAQGFATYAGDHISHYAVNASVPKTLIRYLVEYYAEKQGELTAVLNDILATPVSAELLPPDTKGDIAQKTEDIIGPYVLHDFFLYYFVRFGFSREKTLLLARYAFAGTEHERYIGKWLDSFIRRFYANQFKRSCTPDAPKVGTVSLSPRADWRMPSDIRYGGGFDE